MGHKLLELKAFIYPSVRIDGNKLKRYVKAYKATLKIQMLVLVTKLNDQN